MSVVVKVGADLQLELEARKFLIQNDPQELIRYEAELLPEQIVEVSLDRLRSKAIYLEDILIQDIDKHNLWECDTVNAEQYLVIGTIQRVGGDFFYRQGNGSNLD